MGHDEHTQVDTDSGARGSPSGNITPTHDELVLLAKFRMYSAPNAVAQWNKKIDRLIAQSQHSGATGGVICLSEATELFVPDKLVPIPGVTSDVSMASSRSETRGMYNTQK